MMKHARISNFMGVGDEQRDVELLDAGSEVNGLDEGLDAPDGRASATIAGSECSTKDWGAKPLGDSTEGGRVFSTSSSLFCDMKCVKRVCPPVTLCKLPPAKNSSV